MYAPLLRRANFLVFGCRLQQEQWRGRYRLPTANSRVIYNGVDQARFNPAAAAQTREELRRRYGLPTDAFIAITLGQLRPEKQQTDPILAVAALCSRDLQVHALLVGEGHERGAIERCVADLGVGGHSSSGGGRRRRAPAAEGRRAGLAYCRACRR